MHFEFQLLSQLPLYAAAPAPNAALRTQLLGHVIWVNSGRFRGQRIGSPPKSDIGSRVGLVPSFGCTLDALEPLTSTFTTRIIVLLRYKAVTPHECVFASYARDQVQRVQGLES